MNIKACAPLLDGLRLGNELLQTDSYISQNPGQTVKCDTNYYLIYSQIRSKRNF